MSVAHRPAERAAHPNGAPLRRVATGRPQAPRRSSPQVIVDAPAVGRRIFEGIRRPAAAPDWILIGAVIVLTFIGLVFVFSSSFAISLELHGDTRYFATRQLIGAAIGLVAFFICSRIDYAFWRRLSPLIMGGAIILLLAVLAPGIGSEQNGATRWIQVGALPAFQPSEFAKLAICIYVAAWLVAKGEDIKRVPLGLIPFAIIIALVGFLLMAEPDLGTFVTIAAIGVIMFFLAGAALRHMAVLIAGGAAALFAIIVVVGYGLDRFQAFFNAEEMAQDAGFQIINLVSTLGSGGLTGVGLGASRQKFFYVPSAHTDGVFAIIGEETGLLGAMIVLSIFGVLIYRGIRAGMRAQDRFGTLLAFGIVSWFAMQAFFNVAGVTRTIVLTGIPLPFISFGSSALIASLAAAGILVNISRHSQGTHAAPASGDEGLSARDAAPSKPIEPRRVDPLHSGRGDGH